MLFNTDSFYTFWLMVQALDTSFKTDCQIPTPSAFVSQQVKNLNLINTLTLEL